MRLGLSVFCTIYIVDEYFCEFSTCFYIECLFCRFSQIDKCFFYVFVVFTITTESDTCGVKHIAISTLFGIYEVKRRFVTLLILGNIRTQKEAIQYGREEIQYSFCRYAPIYEVRRRLKDFSYIVESFCPSFDFIFFDFHNDMFFMIVRIDAIAGIGDSMCLGGEQSRSRRRRRKGWNPMCLCLRYGR